MIGFGALELASIGEALGKSRIFVGEMFNDPAARDGGIAGEGDFLLWMTLPKEWFVGVRGRVELLDKDELVRAGISLSSKFSISK